MYAYSYSKLSNIYFSQEFNRRFEKKHQIKSVSLHPGVISTSINRHLMTNSKRKKYKSF